jgi:CoA:oxalate CoA-transferase
LRTAGIPIRFSGAATGFEDVLAVKVGEHNDAIYRDVLGYDAARVEALRQDGVI